MKEYNINEEVFAPDRGPDRKNYRASDCECSPEIIQAIKDGRLWLLRVGKDIFHILSPNTTGLNPAQDGVEYARILFIEGGLLIPYGNPDLNDDYEVSTFINDEQELGDFEGGAMPCVLGQAHPDINLTMDLVGAFPDLSEVREIKSLEGFRASSLPASETLAAMINSDLSETDNSKDLTSIMLDSLEGSLNEHDLSPYDKHLFAVLRNAQNNDEVFSQNGEEGEILKYDLMKNFYHLLMHDELDVKRRDEIIERFSNCITQQMYDAFELYRSSDPRLQSAILKKFSKNCELSIGFDLASSMGVSLTEVCALDRVPNRRNEYATYVIEAVEFYVAMRLKFHLEKLFEGYEIKISIETQTENSIKYNVSVFGDRKNEELVA